MPFNIRPVFIEIIIRAYTQGDVEFYWSVTEFVISAV